MNEGIRWYSYSPFSSIFKCWLWSSASGPGLARYQGNDIFNQWNGWCWLFFFIMDYFLIETKQPKEKTKNTWPLCWIKMSPVQLNQYSFEWMHRWTSYDIVITMYLLQVAFYRAAIKVMNKQLTVNSFANTRQIQMTRAVEDQVVGYVLCKMDRRSSWVGCW